MRKQLYLKTIVLLFCGLMAGGKLWAQTTYFSKAGATDFNDPATWGTNANGTGTAPTSISNADNFTIANSAALSLTGTANVRQLTINAGSLTVAANTLTVAIAGQNNSTLTVNTGGTLTVSGGTLNVNGNMLIAGASTFNQSGGNINVDGNNGGSTTGSAASTVDIFGIGTSTTGFTGTLNLTGGTLTIVDPHTAAAVTDGVTTGGHSFFYYTASASYNASVNHTLQFGNGVSTDAGGNSTNGFSYDVWPGSGTFMAGKMVVNNPSGTNRFVYLVYRGGTLSDLTITNGEFRGNGTTLYVGGNLTNNGILTSGNTSIGGTLYLGSFASATAGPTTTAQTISGTGTFRNGLPAATPTANFASVTVNNTNASGVTFSNANSLLSSASYGGTVSGTLNFIAGRINTSGNTLILGTSASSVGSLSYTAGSLAGFTSGSTFGRWYATSGTGTSISASTVPSISTGSYPFVVNGNSRDFHLTRTGASATSGGVIAITHNNGSGLSTITGITDGAYTVNRQTAANWVVSTPTVNSTTYTAAATTTFSYAVSGQGTFAATTAANRLMKASAFVGTHQAGTTLPHAQRTAIASTDFLGTYFLGVNSAEVSNMTAQSGAWEDPATWTGGVPACGAPATILNGHTVTVNSSSPTSNVGSLTIAGGGALTVSGSTLTVGCTNNNNALINNGTLTVSSTGALTVNGNIDNRSTSTFAQTGGTITVDGNNNGATATSVTGGTPLFWLQTPNVTMSGGTLIIVDPHAGSSTTDDAFRYTNAANASAATGHTLQLGDGTSIQPGNVLNTNGFCVEPFASTGRLMLGNLTVNTVSAGTTNNRFVAHRNSTVQILGNLTVTSGRYLAGVSVAVAGNVLNNGQMVTSGTLLFATGTGTTSTTAVTAPQSIGGTGTFQNSTSTLTANFASVTVNNTSATGVTFSNANSLLSSATYGGTVSGTLTFTAGTINTGTNTFILGVANGTLGTLSYTAGGFGAGSTFGRWQSIAGTGTSISASAAPSNSGAGSYPFFIGTTNRSFYLAKTAATTGGVIAVKYNDGSGFGTISTVPDGSYSVNRQSVANWVVTTPTVNSVTFVPGSATFSYAIAGQGIYSATNGNSRVMKVSSVVGTHQNGTSLPIAQRTAIAATDFLGAFYVGFDAGEIPILSAQSGAWENTSTWVGGVVPTCGNNVIIVNSHTVTVNSVAAIATGIAINSGGVLTVSGSTLTVGCTNNNNVLTNNGTLNVSAGALTVNGNLAINNGSSFSQSGGTITIDGNDNSSTVGNAASVSSGTPLMSIGTSATAYSTGTVSLTGGTLIIVDPHIGNATATSAYAFYANAATGVAIDATTNHTIQFGTGLAGSTAAGSATGGFIIDAAPVASMVSFGNMIVNTGSGTNRNVTHGTFDINVRGDLTITSGTYSQNTFRTYVGGNIVANGGTMIANGTTWFASVAASTITTQTTAQSVSMSGTGAIQNLATSPTGNFTNLTVNNNSTTGVTFPALTAITGAPTGAAIVTGALTFTFGKITTTGTNGMIWGTVAGGATGTLTVTSGGIAPGSKFGRFWTAAQTGTAITAGTAPAAAGVSRLPFVDANNNPRSLWVTRTGPSVAGVISAVYTDGGGLSSISPVTDPSGGYSVDQRTGLNWAIDRAGTAESATSYILATETPSLYFTTAQNSRLMLATSFVGTHQAGTTTPGAQRITIPTGSLENTYYMGVNSADVPFVSVATGNWNSGATWNKGTVPTCTDAVIIFNGHNVTMNTAGALSRNITINTGGTLTVASGDLTVGCTNNNNFLTNNGTLTVSGGTLNVNGNVLIANTSTFNQSGGNINVDGNNGGSTTGSVAGTVDIFSIGTSTTSFATGTVNLTGGTLTIVDPHTAASLTTDATGGQSFFYYTSTGVHVNASANHTLQFGNGVSTDAGGNSTSGFSYNVWANSGTFMAGKIVVNNPSGTNRHVYMPWRGGSLSDFTVTSGEFRGNNTTLYVGGNLINNGTLTTGAATIGGLLNLGSFSSATEGPSATAQTVSGTGTFRNGLPAATPTASFASLTVNNTNATGVTISTPLSVSGTLTMTSGIINTTTTNFITLGTATAAGTLAGTGSATSMFNGPFARTFTGTPTLGLATLFPIGKGSSYNPMDIVPTISANAATFRAESFNSNTGTTDATIRSLSTTRRWEAPIINGAANVSSLNVRLGDAAIASNNIPVQAPSAAGIYTSALGSTATYTAGTPNTTLSIAGVTGTNYTGFLSYAVSNACTGTPAPGATVSSANNICFGGSVTLSLANATVGSGVTYRWQQSADGVTYTNIAGATGVTYTATPTVSTYYQAVVRCASGPDSATSTPVQINFSTAVTGTTPATRCGIGTATLGATGTGTTLNWYADQTGGSPIGTGTSFTTPSINATTTYYVAASTGPGVLSGLGATNVPSNINTYSSQRGIAVNITQGGILNSAQVYVGTAGAYSYTLTLADNTNTAISGVSPLTFSGTAAAPGFQTATLNWPMTPGQYRFLITGLSPFNPYGGDPAGADYSQAAWNNFGAAGTITSGIESTLLPIATAYYGFYNMVYTAACESPRTAVTATYQQPPALALDQTSVNVCGESTISVPVSVTAGTVGNYSTFVWSPTTNLFTDAAATVPYTTASNATTVYVKSPTAGARTYTLSASTVSGCVNVATTTVTVRRAYASQLSITPASTNVCAGSQDTLTFNFGNSVLPSGYCTPTVGTVGTRWIDTFVTTLGSTNITNNASGASAGGFSDLTASFAVAAERNDSIAFRIGRTVGTYGYAVWVDWNQDGLYDTTEQMYKNPSTTLLSGLSAGFRVPSTAPAGRTRMRVSADGSVAQITDPCAITSGESEEYTFIVAPTPTAYSWSNGSTIVGTSNPLPVAANSTTTYTVTATANGCPYVATITRTPSPVPSQPTANNGNHCGPQTPVASVTSTFGGSTFRWYLAATGGTPLANQSGATLNNYPVSATTDFYVTEVTAAGCESTPRVKVTETVTQPATLTLDNTTVNVCGGGAAGSASVTSTLSNYDSYVWSPTTNLFTDPAATVPYVGGSVSTVYFGSATPGANTYTLTASNSVTSCVNTATVNVTVQPTFATSATVTSPVVCAGTLDTFRLNVIAPGSAQVGTGTTMSATTSMINAFYGTYYGNARTQWLITASDLSAAGVGAGPLTALSVNVGTVGSPANLNNFTIKLKETSATTIGSTYETGMTQVYTASSYTPVVGNNTHVFGTGAGSASSFVWNGSSNLLVDVCFANGTTGSTTTAVTNTFTTIGYACGISTYKDGTNITNICDTNGTANVTAQTSRPNFTFTGNVSSGALTNINWVTGGTSIGTTNPLVITVGNSGTYTGSATLNGCTFTASVAVNTNPLPQTPTANNSSQCGTQTPTASVTSTSGLSNPTFRWYTTAAGGTPIAGQTGASLVNYPVSATTTFHVSEVSAAGCESGRQAVVVTFTAAPALATAAASPSFCNGSIGALTLSAATIGNFTNYVWSPTDSLYTDAAATIPYTGGNASTVYIKSTRQNVTNYTVTGTNSSTGCRNTATTSVRVLPTVGITVSPAICGASGTPTASLTTPTPFQNGGSTYAWATSTDSITFTPVPSATSNTYTPASPISVLTYYQVTVTSSGGVTCGSAANGVPVYNPTVTGNTPGSRCGVGTVTLGATGSTGATLSWFANPTGGTALGTGTSFTTPVITTNTTYYVSAAQGGCSSSPRTAVLATVTTPANLAVDRSTVRTCNNDTAVLSVTAATVSNFATYVWSPTTNLFTDAAATTAYTAASNATTVYVKSSTAGAVTYTVTGTDASGTCSNVATSTVTVLPVVAVTVAPTSICISGTPTATLVDGSTFTGAGATIAWAASPDSVTFTTISGAAGITYTPTAAIRTDTFYRATVTSAAGRVCGVSAAKASVNNPTVTGNTPGSRCGAGTVTLGATGSAGTTLNWYAAATGGTSLGSGTSFTTPSISATTTYYVGASSGLIVENAGPSYSGTSSNGVSVGSHGIVINTTVPNVLINSASIPFTGTGTITVQLQNNSTGALILGATSPSVTGGSGSTPVPTTVPLGLNVATPGTYRLIVTAVTGGIGNLGYLSSGLTYPYTTTSTAASITSGYWFGNTTSGHMYLMNLNMTSGCEGSPRTAVVATISRPDTLIVTSQKVSACNNVGEALSVSSGTVGSYTTYVWSPTTDLYLDAAGATPYTAASNATTVYVKRATVGQVVYTVTGTNASNCINSANDTVIVLPPVTVTVTPTAICGGSGTPTATLTSGSTFTAAGATIAWATSPDSSTLTPTGTSGVTYTPGAPISSNTFYHATVTNATGTVCGSAAAQTTVANPTVTSTNGATRCGAGTVTLNATGSAGTTLNWYTAATGGTPVATGTSYSPTVPGTVGTYNYYVSASVLSATFNSSRTAPATVTGGTGTNQGLRFTATSDFTLNSVDVYNSSTNTGTMTIQLQDNSGNMVRTTSSLSVPGSASNPYRATLGWPVTAGTTYRLVMSAGSASLARETGVFPATIAIGSVGNINQGMNNGGGSTSYFNFYNWRVSTSCESSRTAVAATVITAPAISVTQSTQNICNGAIAQVSVSAATSGNYPTFTWTGPAGTMFTDAAATVPYVGGPNTTSLYVKPTTAGGNVYTVTGSGGSNGCSSTPVTATVNMLPVVAVTVSPSRICATGTPTATLNNGTAYTNAGATIAWSESPDSVTFTPVGGATGITYTPAAAITVNTFYGATVTLAGNVCGSGGRQATIIPANVVTTQPTATTVCAGQTLTLTVAASNATGYQWYKGTAPSGTIISGATSATYTVASAAAGNAGNYYVSVTGTSPCAAINSSTVAVVVNPPVAITTQPVNRTICQGQTLTLSVVASNATGYQWYQSGNAISGANSATYTVAMSAVTDSGSYYVAITGNAPCANLNSNPVTVIVNPAVAITVQPTAQTVCSGTSLTLNVTASNATSYQWYKGTAPSGTIINGATSATYNVASAAAGDAGNYYVAIGGTAPCTVLNSSTIAVTVNPAVVINTQPMAQTVCAGSALTLSVIASNTGGANAYQWYQDGNAITGATSPTYTVATAAAGNAGSYYVSVGGNAPCASRSSDTVAVVVNAVPAITASATKTAICSGLADTLNVSSAGMNYTYSWNTPTQTNAAVAYINPTATRYYTVTATDGVTGCVIKDSVQVSVEQYPTVTFSPSAASIGCGGSPVQLTATINTSGTVTKAVWKPAGLVAGVPLIGLYTDAAGTVAYDSTSQAVTLSVYAKYNNDVAYALGITTALCPAITSSNSVEVSVNTASGNGLAQGSAAANQTYYTQSGSDTIQNANCQTIASVAPSGASPVSGLVMTTVYSSAPGAPAPTIAPVSNKPYVPRYYQITPESNATTATGTITLYATNDEFKSYNAAAHAHNNAIVFTDSVDYRNLMYYLLPDNDTPATVNGRLGNVLISKESGTSSSGLPGTFTPGVKKAIRPSLVAWNGAESRWEMTFSTVGFSGFFIGGGGPGAGPLPVTFTGISATAEKGKNRVDWNVGSETNVVRYEVEKQTQNSGSFEKIGTMPAVGMANYTYYDGAPSKGLNTYRVRAVDVDGAYSYSPSASVRISQSGGFELSLFPNPTTSKVTVEGAGSNSSEATVTVSELSGRLLIKQVVSTKTGEIDLSGLPSGTYMLQWSDGINKESVRVTKQ